MVYREVGGQDLIAFTRNQNGGLRASIDFPFEVFDRASFLDGRSFNLLLLIFIAITSLAALLSWPLAALIRRHYHRPLVLSRKQHWSYAVVHLVGMLDLAFFLSWIAILSAIVKNPDSAGPSLYPYLRLLQGLGWLAVLGTLAAIYAVYQLRTVKNRWWLARLGYAAVVLSCVCFCWLLFHWHSLHSSIRF